MASPSRDQRRQLDELRLSRVTAHDGVGEILFHRLFTDGDFVGPWNFIDYAVLPPGTSIGEHRHGQNEEVYLVLEGEGTMTLDGESFAVRPGSVIVNRAGGRHGLVNDSNNDLRLFVVEVALPSQDSST